MFDANLITSTFFKGVKPSNINCGDCWRWAYYAYRLFPGVELWTNSDHAWIKYNGLYYDSESPNGVECFEDLKCNRFMGSFDGEKLSLRLFKDFWREENRRIKLPGWQMLEANIRRFKRNNERTF
jgi:hypothetical protein